MFGVHSGGNGATGISVEVEKSAKHQVNLLVNLGDALYQSAKHDQALKACDEALAMVESNTRGLATIGQ